VLDGQRTHRLGREDPFGRHHRELPSAAGDDLAGDSQVVADVDDVLELGQPLRTDHVQRQHRLQLGAITLSETDEAELSGVAQVDDAARD
jgi:hypothetical protein